MAGADRHIRHGDLVLGLLDHHAALLAVRGEPVQDVRGGAHRIRGVKLAAGGDRAQGQGRVPVHKCQPVGAERPLAVERLPVGAGEVEASARDADVLLDDLRPFVAERVGQHAGHQVEPEPRQVHQGAQRHRILHHRQQFAQIPGDFFERNR